MKIKNDKGIVPTRKANRGSLGESEKKNPKSKSDFISDLRGRGGR